MKTIGTLVENIVKDYRQNFKSFLKPALWVFLSIPLFILGVLLIPPLSATALAELRGFTTAQTAGIMLITTVNNILGFIGITIGTLHLYKLIDSEYHGPSVKFTSAEFLLRKILAFVVIMLITAFALSIPTLLVLIPTFGLLGALYVGNGILALVLMPVVIVTGLIAIALTAWFGALLGLGGVVYVAEEQTIIGSLKRSIQLVRNNFWPFFARYLALKLIVVTIGLVVMVIILVPVNVLFLLTPFTSASIFVRATDIFNQIVNLIPLALLLPVNALIDYHLYREVTKS